MLLVAGFLVAEAQCRFTTHDLIYINDDGSWYKSYTPVAVTLDYWFDHVTVQQPKHTLELFDIEEIINDFPVQKFVYPGYVVMFSNTNFCDWIGVADDNNTVIFINNPMLRYKDIVERF